MKVAKLFALAALVVCSASLAFADSVTDPRIIIVGGGGSTQVSGNTFSGDFLFDNQQLDYQNVSGQTFLSLILTLTPDGDTGPFSCLAETYFSSCSVDGDVVSFFGGPGIPPGENIESFAESFSAEGSDCGEDLSHFAIEIQGLPQGTSASFDAVANSTVPEPASAVLILTGLAGVAGLRKRKSGSAA